VNLLSKFPGGLQLPQGTTDPSAMPTADLPGWNFLQGEDFNTNFAEGQFRTVMGAEWDQYNNFPASPQNGAYEGVYNLAKTGSVTDSVLRIRCWKEAGQTYAWCGAPTPWGGIPQLYGRYSMRLRTTPTVNEDYKTAWLLWPYESGTAPNPGPPYYWWEYGEIDFPEMDLGGTIGGFSHDVTGTPGNNILSYQGNVSSQDWHVLTIEWTPANVRFLIDGNQVARTTNSAGIPSVAMRWVLQTETSLERPHPIAVGSQADVYLDWISVWAYAP
jgi:beta-glucanase (GH16 family)